MWKVLVKLNPDMRSFDEVKKRKCNLFYQCKLFGIRQVVVVDVKPAQEE